MATIIDVAKKAGVGVGTVSRAINKSGPVSEKSLEKINAAMKELNFIPNYIAQSMRSKETKTIGILVPDLSNLGYIDLLRAVESNLRRNDYIPVIASTSDQYEKEVQQVRRFLHRQLDGIIFFTYNIDKERYKFYKDLTAKIPCVFMDQCEDDLPIDQVFTNGRLGLRMSTEYFIKKGYRKIGLIYGKTNVTVPRAQGYFDALLGNNIDISPQLVYECQFDFNDGFRAAQYFAGLPTPPKAVVSVTDVLAAGALKGYKEAGFNVPGDVEIIGYDNIKYSTMLETSLSTVAQPFGEIGQKAVEILINKINNHDLKREKIELMPELILRQSTRD